MPGANDVERPGRIYRDRRSRMSVWRQHGFRATISGAVSPWMWSDELDVFGRYLVLYCEQTGHLDDKFLLA